MEVKYELCAIDNAVGKGTTQSYVRLLQGVPLTADEVERRIETSCSLTRADVRGVMAALRSLAVEQLSLGRRFFLPEIGWLSLSAGFKPNAVVKNNEDGAQSNEEAAQDRSADNRNRGAVGRGKVTGRDIKLQRIVFRPACSLFRDVASDLHFVRSATSSLSQNYDEGELWTQVSVRLRRQGSINTHEMRVMFGLSQRMARRWLARFVETGRLKKMGSPRFPVYVLADE